MLFRCFLYVLRFYKINYQSQISAGKSTVIGDIIRMSEKLGKIRKTEFRQKSSGEPEGLPEGSQGEDKCPQA